MKSKFISLTLGFFVVTANAQPPLEVRLTQHEVEQRFLSSNLQLLAQQFEINLAEADILQAKLWHNPTVSLSEVNLWHNASSEKLPHLFGQKGQYQQIGFSIEQLIETAGKRKKRLQWLQSEKKSKELEFQELLRLLKLELRQTLYEYQALQEKSELLLTQLALFDQLEKAYALQVNKGNISAMEWVRIAAEKQQWEYENHEIELEKIEAEQKIKAFIHLKADTPFVFLSSEKLPLLPKTTSAELYRESLENRTDYKWAQQQIVTYQQGLDLEKASKIPDVTLGIQYDRGGNIMRDFVGIGASIDLPLFNRNQGGIKKAEIQLEQSKKNIEYKENEIQLDIEKRWKQLLQLEKITLHQNKDFQEQLTNALAIYTKNFQNRTLSFLEFMDFVEMYQNQMKSSIENKKNYLQTFEELQYHVGKDL